MQEFLSHNYVLYIELRSNSIVNYFPYLKTWIIEKIVIAAVIDIR